MDDKPKYGPEYWRGIEDAERGAAPDYSQMRTQDLLDYLAGYKDGRAQRAKEHKEQRDDL